MIARLSQRIRHAYRRNIVGVWLSVLAVLLLVLYLLPSMIVTIPAGHAGVLWRRFGLFGLLGDSGGTVLDKPLTEGTHYKWPWNAVELYDIRLQDVTRTFGVIAKDGLMIQTELSVRFRPLESALGSLHKFIGPGYIEVLVVPELGAHARKQMSRLTPSDLYTGKREEVEQAIYRNLVEEFEVRFEPVAALFGTEAHLRRRIVQMLSESKIPLTAEQISRAIGVEPVDFIHQDLDDLVRDDLLHVQVIENVQYYRINSEEFADNEHMNQMLGRGRSLIYVEDVLIRHIELPGPVAEAIQNKLITEQEMHEYDFRIERERKEKERKRVEAEGIRIFQDIVNEGISDRYLKWKGIDATLELAKSPNSKVVIIGSAGDGLPIILGPLETAAQQAVSPPRPPRPVQAAEAPDGTPVGAAGTPATAPPAGGPTREGPRPPATPPAAPRRPPGPR